LAGIWVLIQVVITQLTKGFSPIAAALTASERWSAMRRLGNGSESIGLFEIVALIFLAGLVLLFVQLQSSRFKRKRRQGKSNRRSFADLAGEVGLNERERSLLLLLAERAGLKQPESIFSMGTAFDRGADMVIEDQLDQRDSSASIERLKAELSFLREKLDFKVRTSSLNSTTSSTRLSTRQIPVGKRLYLTAANMRDAKNIEGSVVANTTRELKVRLSEAIDTLAGDRWSVRCPSGISIWEFDTDVLEYRAQVLDLKHTSSVRLASRRRFPRVPVRIPAFVMRYSFAVVPIEEVDHFAVSGTPAGSSQASKSQAASGTGWKPPEFVPAIVTELAGPGMRIESELHAPMGERVLIVLGLDDDGKTYPAENERVASQGPSRVLEDIAVVRHVKRTPDGWSIAVELAGLSDTNTDELIHATNIAGTKLRAAERAADSERMLESVLVQGA
jgi:hypothetical protein